MSQTRLLVFLLTVVILYSPTDAGSPTGWSPIILPTGSYRTQIKAMPIHQRPGRPFHIYGNTVRLIQQSNRTRSFNRPLRQIFFGTTDLAGTLASQ